MTYRKWCGNIMQETLQENPRAAIYLFTEYIYIAYVNHSALNEKKKKNQLTMTFCLFKIRIHDL